MVGAVEVGVEASLGGAVEAGVEAALEGGLEAGVEAALDGDEGAGEEATLEAAGELEDCPELEPVDEAELPSDDIVSEGCRIRDLRDLWGRWCNLKRWVGL